MIDAFNYVKKGWFGRATIEPVNPTEAECQKMQDMVDGALYKFATQHVSQDVQQFADAFFKTCVFIPMNTPYEALGENGKRLVDAIHTFRYLVLGTPPEVTLPNSIIPTTRTEFFSEELPTQSSSTREQAMQACVDRFVLKAPLISAKMYLEGEVFPGHLGFLHHMASLDSLNKIQPSLDVCDQIGNASPELAPEMLETKRHLIPLLLGQLAIPLKLGDGQLPAALLPHSLARLLDTTDAGLLDHCKTLSATDLQGVVQHLYAFLGEIHRVLHHATLTNPEGRSVQERFTAWSQGVLEDNVGFRVRFRRQEPSPVAGAGVATMPPPSAPTSLAIATHFVLSDAIYQGDAKTNQQLFIEHLRAIDPSAIGIVLGKFAELCQPEDNHDPFWGEHHATDSSLKASLLQALAYWGDLK